MKRILITGAAGFVGHHTLRALAQAALSSDSIVGIGRSAPKDLPDGVIFQHLDLLNEVDLSEFIAAYQPTDVLHLAAIASVQQSIDAPVDTWRVNLVGLLNLAEAMVRFTNGSNFFFVSSGEVYGRAFLAGHALTEDIRPEPLGAYARSKWFGEEILHEIMPKSGARLIVLRPFNHIGPGQDTRFVLSSFADQIAKIESGLIPAVLEVGNLDVQRDFLSIFDVVQAYVSLIVAANSIESGSVFNIASGRPRSINSVLDDLRRHATRPFKVRIAPDRMRPSEIPIAAGDASRLTAAIGWTPTEDWNATLISVLNDARAKTRFMSPIIELGE